MLFVLLLCLKHRMWRPGLKVCFRQGWRVGVKHGMWHRMAKVCFREG